MEKINLRDFDAVIFDMDGVLIDSEPLWKIAMEEVFLSLGSKLTKKDFEKTVGLRIDEVIHFWNVQENWNCKDEKSIEIKIIDALETLINQHGAPLPGVLEVLAVLRENNLKIGLATSSSFRLIQCVLSKLDIAHYFDVVHSAEFETHGKPHPAVYISTAKKLKVKERKCLVIEDSWNGVLSGLSAKMNVVCIPEKTHVPNKKLFLADFHFESMMDFLEAVN